MIRGGKPALALRIDDYVERKGGHQSGVVVVTRDGIVLGSRRTKLTDDRDMEKAAQWATELGFEGADAGIQAAWNSARLLKEQADQADDKPTPSRFLAPARWVADQLTEAGRFIRHGRRRLYFNGITKVPLEVASDDMAIVLRHKFGVNQAEAFYKYLVHELEYHAVMTGDEVELRHLAHYDQKDNRLYVDLGNGRMLRADGNAIEEVENATDGVMFEGDPGQKPWKYIPGSFATGLLEELIAYCNFDTSEECPLSIEEQRLLFKVWMLSFFFRSELPTRPIALAYGQNRSGKTSSLERFGQLIYGPGFRADVIRRDKEDDFLTALTNRAYVVGDNADSSIPWLNDVLAVTATGAQISKRTLHKTNELSVFQIDVFLAITARTPRFRREDVAERLLLFYFKRLEQDEMKGAQIQEWLFANRDVLLSEMVEIANQVLLWPRIRKVGSAIRIADFAMLAERIANAIGFAPEVMKALEKQRGAQMEFASEENSLVAAIEEWLTRIGPGGARNDGRAITVRDLHLELSKVAEELGLRWHVGSAEALGRQLVGQSEVLASRFVIDRRRVGGRGVVYRIRLPDDESVSDGSDFIEKQKTLV